MKKSVLSIVLCAAILFTSFAFGLSSLAAEIGTTYYVDNVGGNDLSDGKSPDSAWASLAKANELTYSEGDKILLKAGGIYIAPFVAKGNGTAENPITVSAYGNIETDGKPLVFTNKDVELFLIRNVSGWKIENLEMSAPNGRGIRITADNHRIMSDITVANCDMHDIYFKRFDTGRGDTNRAPLFAVAHGEHSRIDNVTFSDCNISNCAYGIFTEGITMEGNPDIFVSPEVSHNQNFIFEGMSFYNINYDAVIIRADNNVIVRNCAIINASIYADWFTAPMYMANSNNVLVENCEIAGAENRKDGMSIDFDGWTTNSMYQYIYSHDNQCFMRNCLYDNVTKNSNNTVRYCLSVNDNKTCNYLAHPNRDNVKGMENFKFYNNTIVNGCDFECGEFLKNAYIANNIFIADKEGRQFFMSQYRLSPDTQKKYHNRFTGTFTNNCFYGYSVPQYAKNSWKCDPKFAGADLTDKNSFMLSTKSKLIGKGVQVEADMGEHDFYGNPLTSAHNIGCYEGAGMETDGKTAFNGFEYFFIQLLTDFVTCFKRLSYYF